MLGRRSGSPRARARVRGLGAALAPPPARTYSAAASDLAKEPGTASHHNGTVWAHGEWCQRR
jgi:hypothetical protein